MQAGEINVSPRPAKTSNRLGCINLPNSTVAWFQPLDTPAGFIEAGGQTSIEVNRTAQLWVDNSLAMVRLLHQAPLKTKPMGCRPKSPYRFQSSKSRNRYLNDGKSHQHP